MKEKFAKLIDVKSIMTLLLTVVFCVLALCSVISGQEFLTIFTVVVGFYFGTQSQRKEAAASAPGRDDPGVAIPKTADTEGFGQPLTDADVQAIHPPDADETATAK